jgi:hypothetical protein
LNARNGEAPRALLALLSRKPKGIDRFLKLTDAAHPAREEVCNLKNLIRKGIRRDQERRTQSQEFQYLGPSGCRSEV